MFLAACGGSGEEFPPDGDGSPSPTGTVPTTDGTPTATPTPGSPTADTPTPADGTTPTPAIDIVEVQPFDVTADEAVNVRDRPSTDAATVIGGIFPGETATVIGEARGPEAIEGAGDLWYWVEFVRDGTPVRGFVYEPVVERME
jgi:hypothetical protein